MGLNFVSNPVHDQRNESTDRCGLTTQPPLAVTTLTFKLAAFHSGPSVPGPGIVHCCLTGTNGTEPSVMPSVTPAHLLLRWVETFHVAEMPMARRGKLPPRDARATATPFMFSLWRWRDFHTAPSFADFSGLFNGEQWRQRLTDFTVDSTWHTVTLWVRG